MHRHRLSIPTMRMLLVVLICASIGAVAAHGQGDDWPMFGQNPRLTFSTNVTLHYPLRLKWSFVIPKEKKVPGPVALIMASRFPPVVSGGKVVVGGFNGKVHALNAVTGRVLWRRNLRSGVGTICLAPGRVYLATEDGCVYCLALPSGQTIWKTRLSAFSYLALEGRFLYAGNHLHAFCLRCGDGTVLWRQSNSGEGLGLSGEDADEYVRNQEREDRLYIPMIYRKHVFIPLATGHLAARSVRDGRLARDHEGRYWVCGIAHSGFRDTPINPESAGLKSYFAADGRVVVESDLTMRGFHADDLRDAWSRREEWMCNFGTPTNNGAFFWGFGWWSVKTGVRLHRYVYGRGPDSKSSDIVFEGLPGVKPVVAGDSMLFLQGGGFLGLDEIQANRISDGAMLWSTPYERTDNPRVLDADAFVLRPVIANGMLFAISTRGVLYAFGR